jgi:hypothetical protein
MQASAGLGLCAERFTVCANLPGWQFWGLGSGTPDKRDVRAIQPVHGIRFGGASGQGRESGFARFLYRRSWSAFRRRTSETRGGPEVAPDRARMPNPSAKCDFRVAGAESGAPSSIATVLERGPVLRPFAGNRRLRGTQSRTHSLAACQFWLLRRQNRVANWQYGCSGFCCRGRSSGDYNLTTVLCSFHPNRLKVGAISCAPPRAMPHWLW